MKLRKSLLLSIAIIVGACGGSPVEVKSMAIPVGESEEDSGGTSQECIENMDNFWGEADFYHKQLERAIRFGDAACAQKAIKKGQLNINQKIELFGGEMILPLFHALDSSALFFAKNKGDVTQVLKVLKAAGADMSLRSEQGDTALLHALKSADLKKYPTLVHYLIPVSDQVINEQDKKQRAAVEYIISWKDSEALELFIKNKGDLNYKNQMGLNLLFQAIESKWEQGLIALIAAGTETSSNDLKLQTPLQASIVSNMFQASKLLVNRLNIERLNHSDLQGETALSYALVLKNEKLVKLLLDRGVSVNTKNIKNSSPLHYVVEWAHQKFFDRVIEKTNLQILNLQNQQQRSALHIAAHISFSDGLKKMIQKGIDLNVQDNEGRTALHLAKKISDVKLLLDANASLEISDYQGYTPIAFAIVYHNSEALFEFLARNGASVGWTDSNQQNLLHLAVQKNMSEVTRYLVSVLDINAVDKQKQSALFKVNEIHTLHALMGQGPILDLVDKNGETALSHWVDRYLKTNSTMLLEMIETLIRAGADVNILSLNKENILFRVVRKRSSFDSATYYGDLLKIILNSDIDLNQRDSKGQTVLFLVDTVHEVESLKRGSQSGPVNINIKSNNGQTAVDKIKGKIFFLMSKVKLLNSEVENLNEQLESAIAQGQEDSAKKIKLRILVIEEQINNLTHDYSLLETIVKTILD